MEKRISAVYFLVLLIHILARQCHIEILAHCTKTLLMPVLCYFVFSLISAGKEKKWLLISLLFSWLGDLFLMFPAESFFVYGLAAFLVAHLLYVFIFISKVGRSWIRLLPILFYLVLFGVFILWPSVPTEMSIPVMLYMTAIGFMVAFAALRSRVDQKSFEWVLLGALLFMLSDSFIAYDKFVQPISYASFFVMSSYGMAQYLIVKGLYFDDSLK